MIDPTKVTNYNRGPLELEEFMLFAIIVAGKGAFQQAKKLEAFLTPIRTNDIQSNLRNMSPFAYIRMLDEEGRLDAELRSVKMGQYNRIGSAFRAVANFFGVDSNITLSIRLMECIKGVGMKTARFFFMHTMPNQKLACLDTHILRWLGEKGHEVPKTTPNGAKYLALEQIFLGYAEAMGKSPADLDLEIWNSNHPAKAVTK
jgi:hypothetical protein